MPREAKPKDAAAKAPAKKAPAKKAPARSDAPAKAKAKAPGTPKAPPRPAARPALPADPVRDAVVAELQGKHGCHTVILYGSRARGGATPASDYDVLGIRAEGPAFRDARVEDGAYLDLFVYPEAKVAEPDQELLRIRGGVALVQRAGFGDALLAKVDALYAAGPPAWAADEREASRAWGGKMLARAAQGDVEGDYRRALLHTQLLEDYFKARGLWYEGPKVAFAWLERHDPQTKSAFARALAPGAPLGASEYLAARVWSL